MLQWVCMWGVLHKGTDQEGVCVCRNDSTVTKRCFHADGGCCSGCVCGCLCMWVFMYVGVNVYVKRGFLLVMVHIKSVCACVYVCVCVFVCMYVCMYVYVYVYVCVCMCVSPVTQGQTGEFHSALAHYCGTFTHATTTTTSTTTTTAATTTTSTTSTTSARGSP